MSRTVQGGGTKRRSFVLLLHFDQRLHYIDSSASFYFPGNLTIGSSIRSNAGGVGARANRTAAFAIALETASNSNLGGASDGAHAPQE